MFSSYKSNQTSEKEGSCCCSHTTFGLNSNFKLNDTNNISEKEKSLQQNILSNCDSYTIDDKKRIYELERQVNYLMEDNK